MRMIHQDGGAVNAQFDKDTFTPDANGVYDIPDAYVDQARAVGFVDAPAADPAAADGAAAEPPAPAASGDVSASEIAAAAATVETPIEPKKTVPMRAPDGVTGVSHDGQEFEIPSDRICDVPADAVEAFRGMGFTTPAADGQAEELVAMKAPLIWKVPASAVVAAEAVGFVRV